MPDSIKHAEDLFCKEQKIHKMIKNAFINNLCKKNLIYVFLFSGSGRSDNDGEVRGSRSRNARRDDPRRHTLVGDQQYSMAGQGGPLSRTMDLEVINNLYPICMFQQR